MDNSQVLLDLLNRLYKILKITDTNLPEYITFKINLTSYNNILKSSIRSAKQMHYTHIFNKFKNDTRKTWKTIQEILSKTQKKLSKNYFREGETVITDKMEIAKYFNTFFYKYRPIFSMQN